MAYKSGRNIRAYKKKSGSARRKTSGKKAARHKSATAKPKTFTQTQMSNFARALYECHHKGDAGEEEE